MRSQGRRKWVTYGIIVGSVVIVLMWLRVKLASVFGLLEGP